MVYLGVYTCSWVDFTHHNLSITFIVHVHVFQIYFAGVKARVLIREARQWLARMLKCRCGGLRRTHNSEIAKPTTTKYFASFSEIVFNSGGTEANNSVIFSALKTFEDARASQNGDAHLLANGGGHPDVTQRPHVITSNVEHDSVANVLRHLEKEARIGWLNVRSASMHRSVM